MKKSIGLLLVVTILTSLIMSIALTANAASGSDIVAQAEKWLGYYYGWSEDGGVKLDCSGLVQRVYEACGYSVPRLSYDQAKVGTKIAISDLQPGDICCFSYSDGSMGHVGIYVGNNKMIHAPGEGRQVCYGNYISTWTHSQSGCKLEYGRRLVGGVTLQPTPTPVVSNNKPSGISNVNTVLRYRELNNTYNETTRELQECLNYIMNAGLKVDGYYGIKTHDAVKAFQSKYGLTVDGDAGPQTLGKVNGVLGTIMVSIPTPTPHFCTYSLGSNYEKDHPHRVYETCSCGKTRYTGETKKIDGCETCYPPHQHSYVKNYENAHPHKEYQECSCGDKKYTGNTREVENCEECHIHNYQTLIENAHPHEKYKMCSCGDIVYTGKYTEFSDCSLCNPVQKRTLKLQIGVPYMYVDGESTEVDPGRGTVPIMQNDRTLLPIRAVAETFGAFVIWNQNEEKVTIYGDNSTIELWLGNTTAYVNGKNYELDVVPKTINGRTFMPLRFIAESLGLTVGWNDANQTVTIEGEI